MTQNQSLERAVNNDPYRGFPSFIEYAKANSGRFEGMGRTEISLIDPGFYRTALRRGLADKVLPDVIPLSRRNMGGPPLSADKIIKIISSYPRFGGNASQANITLGFSVPTIIKYWRASGLEILSARRPKRQV